MGLFLFLALFLSKAEASSQIHWDVEGFAEGFVQVQKTIQGGPAALSVLWRSGDQISSRQDFRLSELKEGVTLATFGRYLPLPVFSLRSTANPDEFALEYLGNFGTGGTRQILFRWNARLQGVELLGRQGWIQSETLHFKLNTRMGIPIGLNATVHKKQGHR